MPHVRLAAKLEQDLMDEWRKKHVSTNCPFTIVSSSSSVLHNLEVHIDD